MGNFERNLIEKSFFPSFFEKKSSGSFFVIMTPLKRQGLSFLQHLLSLSKNALCQVWLRKWPRVLEKAEMLKGYDDDNDRQCTNVLS